MAALTTQNVNNATGLQQAPVAAAGGGDTFTPGDRTWLEVTNGGGSPITVTLGTFPDTAEWGGAIADHVVTVTNATTKKIGPLVGSRYANPATGIGSITYSGVTSVTVGVYAI